MSFPRLLKYSDLILLTIQYRWGPTIDALNHRLSYNPDTIPLDFCLLCEFFANTSNSECQQDCPIFVFTGATQCTNTSYYRFLQAYHYEDKIKYAREMLSLLWTVYSYYVLRPEINKEIESTEEMIRYFKMNRKEEGLPPIKLFE